MAGFELSNSETTANLLFRINRNSQQNQVFWAIIGHTPKDTQKLEGSGSNPVARLRGSAMWSTTPRTVMELRIAGPSEDLSAIKEAHPEVARRDIVIAAVVKSNSKQADFEPRILRRLSEGAFADLTRAFPSTIVDEDVPSTEPPLVSEDELTAVLELIRLVSGGSADATFTRSALASMRVSRSLPPGPMPGIERRSTMNPRIYARGICEP